MKKWLSLGLCLFVLLGSSITAGCGKWDSSIPASSDDVTQKNGGSSSSPPATDANAPKKSEPVSTITPYNCIECKKVVGIVAEKTFGGESFIGGRPITLFSIKQDDGSIYHAGMAKIESKEPVVGDRVEFFVDEGETIGYSDRLEVQKDTEGYTHIAPIRTWWYQIVKYKVLE